MSAPHPADEDLILTLASNDTWLHAGTVAETLAHAISHRDTPEPVRLVEFFDAAGRRLEPLVSHDLVVRGFRRAGGRAAPATVRRRVNAVLDRAESHLAHPEHAGAAPSGASVPRPQGSLAGMIAELRTATGGGPGRHAMGWFHNLLHALGG